jgi:hypothetical protein
LSHPSWHRRVFEIVLFEHYGTSLTVDQFSSLFDNYRQSLKTEDVPDDPYYSSQDGYDFGNNYPTNFFNGG